MQDVIVTVAVALAGWYLFVSLIKPLKKKENAASGCSGCGADCPFSTGCTGQFIPDSGSTQAGQQSGFSGQHPQRESSPGCAAGGSLEAASRRAARSPSSTVG